MDHALIGGVYPKTPCSITTHCPALQPSQDQRHREAHGGLCVHPRYQTVEGFGTEARPSSGESTGFIPNDQEILMFGTVS